MERRGEIFKTLIILCVVVLIFGCVQTYGFDKLKAGTVEYGGTCDEDYECVHWRMYCNPDGRNCSCWRFHDIVITKNGTECVENMDEVLQWLSEVKQNYNFSGQLEKEASSLFFYFGLSGILSLGLGFMFALGCVVLIIVNHKSDHKH